MLRALLIEDDRAALRALRATLGEHERVSVTGEATSVSRARRLLARQDYDLVFLDVQMQGAENFALVPLVAPTAQIVIVTSSEQFAARAFDLHALDYLVKPVSASRLASCLAKAAHRASYPPFVPQQSAPEAAPTTICLSSMTGSEIVPRDSICAVVAEQNYTAIWLSSGQRRLVRRPLKDWEAKLPAPQFARVARGALVNLTHVVRIEKLGPKGAMLSLAGYSDRVRVSHRRAAEVRASLVGSAAK